MKKLMLLFVLLMPLIVNAGSKHMRGFWMANHLYASESSVSLPQEYKDELGQLLMDVWDGSTYQDCYAAQKAAQYLQKDVDTRLEALKNLTSEDESKKVALENSLFIIEQQQNWLQVKVQELAEKLTVKDKVFGFFYDVYATVINFFGKQDVIVVGNTATKIYDYARFEREQLFINFQATSQWLSVQKKVGFPNLIYFWKDKKAAHLLLLRLKKYGQNIQLLSFLVGDVTDVIIDGVEETGAEATSLIKETSIDDAIIAAQEESKADLVSQSINESGTTQSQVINKSIDNIAQDVVEGSVEQEVVSQLDNVVKEVAAAPATASVSVVDKLVTSIKSAYSDVADWYGNSAVGKVFKAIGKAYDETIEAAYKKYIYDNLIAPLENNPLNKGLQTVPHYLKGPIDMLIQVMIMNGGGMITNWVNDANTKAFNKLQAQANAYNEGYKVFTSNLQASQAANMTIAINNFSDLLINNFSKLQNALYNTSLLQLSMISKSLLKQQDPIYYLNNPTDQNNYTFIIDQYFNLSPMYSASTPALSNPIQIYSAPAQSNSSVASVVLPSALPFVGSWHNVWRVGNWEYIANNKAFYQLTLVPLKMPTSKNNPSIADQALNNMVFTEYYPKSSGIVPAYTISVDINITQVTYPFFIGVVFNNARWISGIQNRSRQQRYAGFYGAPDKTIYLIVEESLISSQDQIKAGAPSMQSPFYVITNNSISSLATQLVSANTVEAPFSGQYNLSINTQPTEASITLTNKTTSTPVVTTLNATNLNGNFYNFHGVGLVSAGACASFIIQQPTSIGAPTAILSQTKG